MKNKKHLLWIVPVACIGIVMGLLLVAIGLVTIPAVRQKIVAEGVRIANEKTDYDIVLDRLYLSPFHQPFSSLFTDSIVVEIDSLFIGHSNQDTLLYIHHLSASALPLAWNGKLSSIQIRDTIPLHHLVLDEAVAHTDSMIEAVKIDAQIGTLRVSSRGIVLAQGQYPLHHLRLADADIAITLNDTPEDTTATDTTMLMAFDVQQGELDHFRFRLEPIGLDIATQTLQTTTLADVGHNLYDVPSLCVGSTNFRLGSLSVPIDTLFGDARIDIDQQLITSNNLHARCDSLAAEVNLSATYFDLDKMWVRFDADAALQGNSAHAQGTYDIENEAYDLTAYLHDINLAPFIDSVVEARVAGQVKAKGQGLDFKSRTTNSCIQLALSKCVYNQIDASGIELKADWKHNTLMGHLYLPVIYSDSSLHARTKSEHQFRVVQPLSQYPHVDYHAQLDDVQAQVMGEQLAAEQIKIDFRIDTLTQCELTAPQLAVTMRSPQHILALLDQLQPLTTAVADTAIIANITSCRDLTYIDTLCGRIPNIDAHIQLAQNGVAQPIIEHLGLDIDHVNVALYSDTSNTHLALEAAIPTIGNIDDTTSLRFPPTQMQLVVDCKPSTTDLTLDAMAAITDGVMTNDQLCSDVALTTHIHREEQALTGSGQVTLDSLSYGEIDLGSRTLDFNITPSKNCHSGAFTINAQLDDIPLNLVDSLLQMPELDLNGAVRVSASVDGLPSTLDMSAQVLPHQVKARYQPYEVELALGETPITMEHNNVYLNGLPIYGVDSSFITLDGSFNLDSLQLDITLASDSFAPVRLQENGPLPVYGDFAAAISGRVRGPLDHFDAQADIDILPVTDITYPIDNKNMAQVFPTGKVHVGYSDSLMLGGQININKGLVKYSPKAYPMLPFQVDSGSYVRLNGPIGASELAISASQAVKADVQSEGQDSRRVDFNAGVKVNGPLDSLGLESIGFFLEAPNDDEIRNELNTKSEEDRNGLAMILLGTGMYVGESNVAVQKNGYAMSSILNSKLNAAMANSKMGKVVDIDLSSGEKTHGNNVTTQDMGLIISKSFFKDKMKVSVGTSLSDNPEVNKTQGLLNSLTADFKLVPSGNVLAHLFSRKDYDNVLEGELNKSGVGIRAWKDWKHQINDSLQYIYSLSGDADVIYRSNNSIGPDASLTLSARNLMGNNEALSLKLKGAYYWSLNKNFSSDPKNKNTYKLGADLAFVLPYLHWGRDDAPQGNTRYFFGYQYENIAGGYDIHKLSASFSYFIRQGEYITHSFTPFSISSVMMSTTNPQLKDQAADYPQLIAVLLGDELVPAIEYSFTYDNYRSQRMVNSFFDWNVKESGNLINTIYTACGKGWNTKNKGRFNQFIKTSVELRNKFNITPTICFATRLFMGAIVPLGNSDFTPMSEKFHIGGPLSMRAAAPNSYGPGNFYSPKYNQAFFHTGDFKLEANVEFRFPIVWKLRGAVFADVGNVWNWVDTWDVAKTMGEEDFTQMFGFTESVEDGFRVKNMGEQLALGTGFGLRLDIEAIVIRLDLGVGLHLPYQTYKRDKQGNVIEAINKYYNIPTIYDGLRVNFGIGYPF